MKRRDDNRQMRPEEVEALNDVTEEAGTFSRASSEVLASRRIVKSKRSSLPSSDAPSGGSNPFAAFGSLTKSTTSSQPGAVKANPFASLTSLKGPDKSVKPSAPSGFGATNGSSSASNAAASPIKQKPMSFGTDKPTATSFSSSFATAGASAPITTAAPTNKIGKLNKSLMSWMDKQIVEHPVSVWKGGCQDYLKYADKIAEQLPQGSSSIAPTQPTVTPTANETTKAPATTSSSTSSFKFGGSSATSSAPPAKPSVGFLGQKSTAAAAPAPATANTTSTAAIKPSFGFLAQKSTAAASGDPTSSTAAPNGTAAAKPSFGGFTGFKGFGGAKTTPSVPATESGSSGGAGGGDEEEDAEPVLEPEEVLKNATDTDEILHETACKLFRYDKELKEWKENGKGTLRVTVEPGKSPKRILIRNTLGKITVNANICKGMNFKKSGKNGIQFLTVNEKGDLTAYMAKVKPEALEGSLDFLSKAESEAS